jgi:hypothetical protein
MQHFAKRIDELDRVLLLNPAAWALRALINDSMIDSALSFLEPIQIEKPLAPCAHQKEYCRKRLSPCSGERRRLSLDFALRWLGGPVSRDTPFKRCSICEQQLSVARATRLTLRVHMKPRSVFRQLRTATKLDECDLLVAVLANRSRQTDMARLDNCGLSRWLCLCFSDNSEMCLIVHFLL